MDQKFSLVIRFFDEKSIKSGLIEFNNNYFNEIKRFYPSIIKITTNSIEEGIGIFAKKAYDDQPVKRIRINTFNCTPERLRIKFEIDSDLPISSGIFRKRIWAVLAQDSQAVKDQFLPQCIILTKQQMQQISNPVTRKATTESNPILLEILEMKKKNQWLSIVNKFSPIDKLERIAPDVWNNPKLISEIGFALGKLAETSPRDIPRDEPKKTEFLKQQSIYRILTEKMRKRCIELAPTNASYYSDLAYLYYLNAIEISLPHGRKGNIVSEINNAITYFDKALSIDCTRIKDLYRKGYLLTHLLPKQILFGNRRDNNDFEARSGEAEAMIQQGITLYNEILRIWESLPKDDYKKGRNRNDYLKTLYSLGDIYHDTVFSKWDETIYALQLKETVTSNDKPVYYFKDMEKLDNAWNCFYKCWKMNHEFSDNGDHIIDDVLLFYSMGKVLLSKYWLLSGEGQIDSPEAVNALSRCIGALEKALEQPWKHENQYQDKGFIAERLARAFIAKNKPDLAVSIINKHRKRRLDAYVANTLALALTISGKNEEAQGILNDAINNHGNKELWLSYFLMGCSYLEQGNIQSARDTFLTAQQEAVKSGKQNIDGLFIGQAFCAYKSNQVDISVQCLEEALNLNPYRYSIQHRLTKWRGEKK